MKKRSRAHILIVEDTEENIDILMETLADDFSISVALNGLMALKLVEKQKPDLILLDIQMPIMDGYETCQKLKANPETADIPVMFLTALTEEGDESKGLDMGAVDFVTKPYNPFLVKARVRNQIELKKHKDQLEDLVKDRTASLREAHEKLLLIDDTKSDFLGAISHELRTPVNGVLGVAQLAIDYIADDAMKEQLSALFEIGHERLIETIDNGLLLAKLQTTDEDILLEQADLHAIVKKELEAIAPVFEEKALTAKIGGDDIESVRGNLQLFSQVFRTILRMCVGMAGKEKEISITIMDKDEGRGIAFSVEGEQFTETLLETIFEPFSYERASSYISDLGLAPPLAEKIVKVFGGTLLLGNQEDSGVWVEVLFPV